MAAVSSRITPRACSTRLVRINRATYATEMEASTNAGSCVRDPA